MYVVSSVAVMISSITLVMTTRQSTDEDCVMWLKALEKASKWILESDHLLILLSPKVKNELLCSTLN